MDSTSGSLTPVGTRYSVKLRTGAAGAAIKVNTSNDTADGSGNYFFRDITGSGTCTITRTIASGATPSDVVLASGPCLSIAGSLGGAGTMVKAGSKEP